MSISSLSVCSQASRRRCPPACRSGSPTACRSVEIAPAGFGDLLGEGDEAYGNRVFLRHYCVLLAGADPVDRSIEYPADLRAARGFNGDIAQHLRRWQEALAAGADPSTVGRAAARKSLLAVAGLVSVHDRAWTTDRVAAAERWSTIDPPRAVGLATLLDWIDRDGGLTTEQVVAALAGSVTAIVDTFDRTIGLWRWPFVNAGAAPSSLLSPTALKQREQERRDRRYSLAQDPGREGG
jgi:hypothetical protein